MAVIPNWRTSTYTKSDSCVEVADNGPAAVMVRDTKGRHLGTLLVPPTAWAEFVEFSKAVKL
ncbi:DUF397 domain-containing protein [Streptomyces sp. NPDC048680]|uniref:DUF397 domain-containing protein n=1 Tax=Streptomyces sp. NPDC048680 TaxID=3155492 RepID=UPI00342E2473